MLIAALVFVILGAILRFIDTPMLDLLFYGVGIVLFCNYLNSDTPTAMDIYQGKTTLEITYRNGVPVDSVVVFKNKEK